MTSHRTTARGLLSVVLTLTLASAAWGSPGLPEPSGPKPPPSAPKPPPKGKATPKAPPSVGGVPRLIFPVLGHVHYDDNFGDARGNGAHDGIDIMAPRRALALAAEAGNVEFHTTSARAGCMLYLHGRSGTDYLYIHLNNDLGKANDNRGKCIGGVAYANGLTDGERVAAGEPVGFVGNSGDAEGGSPHLHFEVHPKGRGAVNPYPHLRAAWQLLFSAKPGSVVDLTLNGKVVEADHDALTLKVDRLRARPGDLALTQVDRTVELEVPPTASVFDALGALVTAAKLARAKRGQPAVVDTQPREVTLEAQLGAPRTLAAAVVRLGS